MTTLHPSQIDKNALYYDSEIAPGCGAVDSALGLGPRGRRFEPFHPDHNKYPQHRWGFYFGVI